MSPPEIKTGAIDPVALSEALIRRPSVTPADAGALDVLQSALEGLGFRCERLRFSEAGTDDVENLYARFGDSAPNFCFAGHTDVVPAGDVAAWHSDPFEPRRDGDLIYGRGAADMKCAIAAFAAAAQRVITKASGRLAGSISFLITGDEEGPAINGTRKVLQWMADKGERIDHCLVGEPTNPMQLGDMIKIGRRGSLSAWITVRGVQGHVAYPHLAANPVPPLLEILRRLKARELDRGNDHFQPSNLEITSVDVGNPATNVIPAEASAILNIRFNDAHDSDGLSDWIRRECTAVCDEMGVTLALRFHVTGEAFLTPPGTLSTQLADAVEAVLGRRPELSTSGGTSDARFIKDHCPVVEFGLVGQSMHKVDEHASVQDVAALTEIYDLLLSSYFGVKN